MAASECSRPRSRRLALQALERSRPYIDSDRVAVWGASGGGSNTLNLMFRHPELYKVGMSVAPVPDQRLYDSIYQERFMGLPQSNPDGYKAGSPINFAKDFAELSCWSMARAMTTCTIRAANYW